LFRVNMLTLSLASFLIQYASVARSLRGVAMKAVSSCDADNFHAFLCAFSMHSRAWILSYSIKLHCQ
jgi:hypothetical protein